MRPSWLVVALALVVASPGTRSAPEGSGATDTEAAGAGSPGTIVHDDWEPDWEPAKEWRRRGDLALRRRLDMLSRRRRTAGVARNVVLIVGDGMGIATTTAAGIMRGGEGHLLAWEQFPTVGLAKTYSVDHQVPDSAATATAMLSGSKTRSRMLGLDARANKTTCDAHMNTAAALKTMAAWAQEAGRAAGVVTTARITHATPAAAYARINHRDWECDSEVPADSKDCAVDIARQLVEELPGKELRVVLGGGRRQLGATGTEDFDEDNSCVRTDRRNLTSEWLKMPGRREYVTTAAQLLEPGLPLRAEYLLGLFAGGHMAYEAERTQEQPSLADMARVAVRALRRRPKGFFLLVEGARVDMAHHQNWARLALVDALALENAVNAVLDEVDLSETLVVVTGDHSHAMTINGYPERGSDILDIAYPEDGKNDPKTVKYETLSYSTGPGAKDHKDVDITSISSEKRQQLRYRHMAGLYTGKDETHAGEDVPVYAAGAGSELFSGVYEQSYIATAMAYAAGVDRYANEPDVTGVTAAAAAVPSTSFAAAIAVALAVFQQAIARAG